MLAHFYHVYADGAWQAPVAEHLAALEEYGLTAALDVKCAGVVGTAGNCQAAIGALGPGWQIAVTAATGYEQVTLRKLHAFAALDGKVLYAHTKAASRPERLDILWRRRMTECTAGMWRECTQALDSGFDAAGPHWITPEQWPTAVTTPLFGGNFWWANLSWLRRLPAPGDSDRFAAERWIGETEMPRVLDLLPGWPTDGLEAWAAGGRWGG